MGQSLTLPRLLAWLLISVILAIAGIYPLEVGRAGAGCLPGANWWSRARRDCHYHAVNNRALKHMDS